MISRDECFETCPKCGSTWLVGCVHYKTRLVVFDFCRNCRSLVNTRLPGEKG